MKIIIHCLLFLFLSGIAFNTSVAQPFSEDIAVFKKQDSVHFPPRNAILLYPCSTSVFTTLNDVSLLSFSTL